MEEETMTLEELASAMEDRAATYKFLSDALLHEYTEEQIEQLRGVEAPEAADEETKQAFADIRKYLAHAGADPRTDLAVDYARVFLSAGVYDGLTAEPYESVFTSEEQLLMQDARDSVVAIYRANGVDVDESLHMPEDHLGLEFDFLSVMATQTAEACRAEEFDAAELSRLAGVQADFCEEHILNWIDQLTEKVDEFAQLPLYPAIMRIAKSFVKNDAEVMHELAISAAIA